VHAVFDNEIDFDAPMNFCSSTYFFKRGQASSLTPEAALLEGV
jgi:hypothetical protein